MAKSKSGGTRSYIRGRVGADVYSIGKDAMGKKQQVVRSLAESVANPQTEAQMRGRMIMSTVMQAESVLAPIVDHSFDGVPNGQPSLSEFIRRNYALVKADVAAHPASGNKFGLVAYGAKGAKAGAYVIASGKQVVPSAVSLIDYIAGFSIQLPSTVTLDALTVGVVKAALGLKVGDFLTNVCIASDSSLIALRLHVPEDSLDETVITAANFKDLFQIDEIGGNFSFESATFADDHKFNIQSSAKALFSAANIVSVSVNGAWEHNTAVMSLDDSFTPPAANAVLPTYPIGAQRFLNGGEI